jgi:hypothetical protein
MSKPTPARLSPTPAGIVHHPPTFVPFVNFVDPRSASFPTPVGIIHSLGTLQTLPAISLVSESHGEESIIVSEKGGVRLHPFHRRNSLRQY